MDIQTDGTSEGTILYRYDPNGGAACLFIALFGLSTLAHCAEMFRLRSWYFLLLIIGCIMETFGYYGRFWSSQDPRNFKAFVLQSLLITPAPVFIGATIYTSLSRVVGNVVLAADLDLQIVANSGLGTTPLPDRKPGLRVRRWMTPVFIILDILCFIVQMAGTGMQVTTSAHVQKIGGDVVVAGMVLQFVVFSCFILATWRYHKLLKKARDSRILITAPAADRDDEEEHPHVAVGRPCSTPVVRSAVRYIQTLFAVSGCVLLRNLVRVIEYALGFDGAVQSSEAFIYIFDATLMFLVVLALLVVHPGRISKMVREIQRSIGPTELPKAG